MVSTHIASEIGHADLTAGEKHRVLEQLLRSDTFARSERLKSLLRFLCEAEIEGREGDLTEYNIGTMALGRSADFSPLEDSSVRSRSHELRQRLEKYYALESPSARVRIELRKGSYVPRFCVVNVDDEVEASGLTAAEPEPATPSETLAVSKPVSRRPVSARPVAVAAIGFAAGAVLMFAGLATWSTLTKPGVQIPATRLQTVAASSPWTPELEAVWAPFIGTRTPLLITFENRFFIQMGPLSVRDWRVNNIGAVETSDALMKVQKLFGIHQLYPTENYTDVGTPAAMFYLTRLLSSRVPAISVKGSYETTAPDIRDNNLILVGKPWTEPQIEKVLAGADLRDARGRIIDAHPAPGQPTEYKDVNDNKDPGGWSEKYSVITMMPNPASGSRILALTGSGSEHPAALAYYLTNPVSVKELYRHLSAGSAHIPDNYQILVRAVFRGKALVKAEYVTHRALHR
jgi:hypothetical protein